MVDIMFPLRGLDIGHVRINQPPETSAAMLNVVPFDRDFRGRGACRPGTSKFASTLLGSGQSVLLVEQVTTTLDPSTITPSTQLVGETWQYPNGEIGTASGGIWYESDFNNSTGGSMPVSSDTLHLISSNAWARYQPSTVLGSTYILETTMTFPVSPGGDNQAGILFRAASSHSGTVTFISAYITYHNGTNKFSIDTDHYPSGSGFPSSYDLGLSGSILTVGVPFTLQVNVVGDVIGIYVNGIEYVSFVTTLNNTDAAFGIYTNAINGTIVNSGFSTFIGQPLADFRKTVAVAVCGGSIYIGNSDGMDLATNGASALSSFIKPHMAYSKGICYFVDTTSNLKTLDVATQIVADIVPTAGAETATTLGTYRMACTWRDRLVLAGQTALPQNFIMSRQSVQTDWDYSQTDAAAAVAGNASRAGAIGDPLNCLMPWTDDVLVLGGDHSIYQVQGDIAAGGQILVVSESIGTLGPDCWDIDPIGRLYFIGTDGVYQWAAGGAPTNLANSAVRSFFTNIDRTTTYVTATWDRDRNGLYIHLTPVNPGLATHLFFDATTGGFFPISYPDSFGPTCAIVFDGDGPTDRTLLLGCRDGYIRQVDNSMLTDDGTGFANYVLIGPFRPAGDAAISVMEALEVMLGDAPNGLSPSDFSMGLTIIAAKDVYSAINSPERTVAFGFTQQARRKRIIQRISGGTFFFEVSGVTGKWWSLEKLVGLFTQGGLARRY